MRALTPFPAAAFSRAAWQHSRCYLFAVASCWAAVCGCAVSIMAQELKQAWNGLSMPLRERRDDRLWFRACARLRALRVFLLALRAARFS
jgi:hypothetical protein